MSDPVLIQEHSVCLSGGLGGGTTLAITGSATTAGNLLVAFVSWGSQFTTFGVSDAFTFPAGWVRVDHTPTGAGHYEEMWYYWNNPGGITTVSVTGPKPGGTNNAVEFMWVGEYNNVSSGSDPLEQHHSTTGSSNAPSVSTTVADAAVGNLVVACFGWQSGSNQTFTHGTGYTDLTIPQSSNVHQDQLVGEYNISTAASTQTANGTIGSSEAWGGIVATFKPAATSIAITAVEPLEARIRVVKSVAVNIEARGPVSQTAIAQLEAQQRETRTAAAVLEAQLRLDGSGAIPIEEDSAQVVQTGILAIEARGPTSRTAAIPVESFAAVAGDSPLILEARTGMNALALPVATQIRVVQTATVRYESFKRAPSQSATVDLEAVSRRTVTAAERVEARGLILQPVALPIEAGGHQVTQLATARLESGVAARQTTQPKLEARGAAIHAASVNLESWKGIGGPQTALVNIETIPGLHLATLNIESRAPAAVQTAAIPLEMRGLEFNVHQALALRLEIAGRRIHSLSPFPRIRIESRLPLVQTALANVESTAGGANVRKQAVLPLAWFEDPNAQAELNIEIRPHAITPVQLRVSLESRQAVEGRLYLPLELRQVIPHLATMRLEARGAVSGQQSMAVETRRRVIRPGQVGVELAQTRVAQQARATLEARGFVSPVDSTLQLESRLFQGTLPPGAEDILVITRAASGDLIVHEALPLSES